ncbi:MAG: hypothetical protein LC799_18400, partial [Actinobacteria bacterium]|nr:hypothetical protein [Actinomycetota bacterium]
RTIGEVEELRRRTRGLLRSSWFPLVVFGPLMLASVPVGLLGGGPAVGVFWAVAGPAGGVAVGVYYRNRALQLGVSRSPLPYAATMAMMMVGAFVLPALTAGDLREVVSLFAIAAGFVVFAVLDRDPSLIWLGVALGAVPLLFLAVAPDAAAPTSSAVLGAAFLITGLTFRRAELASAT